MVVKKRRNFLPTLALAILSWLSWGYVLFKIPPGTNISLTIFFFLLFLAVFLTGALIFANSRRGLILAIFFISFLLFRYYQIANNLTIILMALIFITLEIYFSR